MATIHRHPRDPDLDEDGDHGPPEPNGVGGWLALLGVGIFGAFVRQLVSLPSVLWPFLSPEMWLTVTTPGSPLYHPLWTVVAGVELVGTTALMAGYLVLLTLLIRRSPRFPRAFVWITAAAIPYLMLDAWLVSQVSDTAMIDNSRDLVRTCVSAAIWISYILKSERVRNTFGPRAIPWSDHAPIQSASP